MTVKTSRSSGRSTPPKTPRAAPRPQSSKKKLTNAALDQIKKKIADSKGVEPEKLGRQVYALDLTLHEVDLYETIHSLAKELPESARPQFVGGYNDASLHGVNTYGMKQLAKATLSRTVTPNCTRIGIDPSTGDSAHSFMLDGAYEATPVSRIELHYENGAKVARFPGQKKAKPEQLPATFLDELQARHFGIKGVSVEKGAVLVRVGNRFQNAYREAIDKLVKRKLGDFPVEVRVDNRGDAPLSYMKEGVEVYVHPDATVVPFLKEAQAASLTEQVAHLGVLAVNSLPVNGTFVQVPEGTSAQKAQEILAAVTELLPSDHVCLFFERGDVIRERPERFVFPQNVVLTKGLTIDELGYADLHVPTKDSHAGLRDGDVG